MAEKITPSTEKIDKFMTLIKQSYDLYNELSDAERKEAEHLLEEIEDKKEETSNGKD